MNYRILVVEDEPSMRMGLQDNLEFDGYEVEVAEEGNGGLDKILSNRYDLIVLDVMLPNISGFDICKAARKKGIVTPIILLTAKGEEIDKVRGLELGADDYITKPFSLRELLARVKAVLRRTQNNTAGNHTNDTIKIGRLTVDFSAYTAQQDEQPVKMSHKEFEILHYFWNERNKTVSRDDLLDKVWGYYDEQPTTRTVDNFILKLRQKIEQNPNAPKIILTVHGIGYKMIY